MFDNDAGASLEAWRCGLAKDGRMVPRFDPADGGAAARMLMLLETPGPGMDASSVVSRDNPSGTARNLRRFLSEAGIIREDTILWNAVPWIVHAPGARNRPLRRAEIAEGLTLLPPFLTLLPCLRIVVLAGRVAALAAPVVRTVLPKVVVLPMPHPSPTYVCTSPTVPARIRATLTKAAWLLQQLENSGPAWEADKKGEHDWPA